MTATPESPVYLELWNPLEETAKARLPISPTNTPSNRERSLHWKLKMSIAWQITFDLLLRQPHLFYCGIDQVQPDALNVV